MVNIASPAAAFQWWRSRPPRRRASPGWNSSSAAWIRVHPMALVHPERVTDPQDAELAPRPHQRLRGPKEYFVDVAGPRHRQDRRAVPSAARDRPAQRLQDQRVRAPDRRLGLRGTGGEPDARVPRASRYYDERYREGFALECLALKRVREEARPSATSSVMIPFCRTPQEADKVLAVMAGERPGPGQERTAGLHDVRDPFRRGPCPEVPPPASTDSRSVQ